MKHFFLFALAVITCFACQKEDKAPSKIQDCAPASNDTLMVLYPCDEAVDFDADSFAWSFGAVGENLEGIVEIRIKKANPPYNGFSDAYWSGADADRYKGICTPEITLLANTTYEWFMTLRHDGNGLLFQTPIRRFTTSDKGVKPPDFSKFLGKYAVQDTFVERIQVFDSPSTFHYEDVPPVAQAPTVITILNLPGEDFYYGNTDVTLRMQAVVGVDTFKITMHDKGDFFWSDGGYHTSHSLAGKIYGDSIYGTQTWSSNMSPIYRSHRYNGKRQ